MRFAKNPNFYSTSNRRAAPSAMTKTKVLVWRKGRTAILHEVQVGNRILRGLQIVFHVVVWCAVQEGLVCSHFQ